MKIHQMTVKSVTTRVLCPAGLRPGKGANQSTVATATESRIPASGFERQSCDMEVRKLSFRTSVSGAKGVVKEIEHFLDVLPGLKGGIGMAGIW